MKNEIVSEEKKALDELKRLSQMKPADLWEEFPERKQFKEKVVVDYDNAMADPIAVHTQFVNYVQIPKRKPWVLDKICKRLRDRLDQANDPATLNIHNDENTLENY